MGVHLYTNGAWTDSGRIYRNSLNEFDKLTMQRIAAYVTIGSNWTLSEQSASVKIPILSNTQYTLSVAPEYNRIFRLYWSDDENITPTESGVLLNEIIRVENMTSYTFTTDSTAKCLIFQGANDYIGWFNSLMLNLGSTALPYEPYNVVDWYTNTGHGYSSGAWS